VTAAETPRGTARFPGDGDLERLLSIALEEDLGSGDVTTLGIFPEDARARARLIAKEPGVLAGLDAFLRVFERLDPEVRAERHAEDGARLRAGDVVVTLEGRIRALLSGERTALNLVQHLSGIATLTARFVAEARKAGEARVLDTRKTTPGLRRLEKHAVHCGGGENHRFGLFDEVLLKNNHVDLARDDLRTLVGSLRQRYGARMRITAEARDEREARACVEGGADVVLLDNLSPAVLRELGPRLRALPRPGARPLELEASGGITLANVAEYAASGVDRLSIGALTHSAPALDLALRLEPSA